MSQKRPQFPSRTVRGRLLALSLAPLLAFSLAGCSSTSGDLRLVSLDQKHTFSQHFTQAYIARNESGDADIVLVEDAIHPVHHDPSKPQPPDDSVLPRELVHIRVFWKPMSGVKPDHPANTNASIHWCFICDSANELGSIEYCGSGLVQVDGGRDGADVTVRKAWMKERCQHGQMNDPLGPSILTGSFHATRDDAQVKAVIGQIKTAGNSTDEAQATSVNPVN
jgi:hypothetical protein